VTGWTTAMQSLFPVYPPTAKLFSWGDFPRQSSAIRNTITGIVGNTTVRAGPSGATPVVTDLTTHQYRHALRIAAHHGRRWVAYFDNQNIETDAGLGVVALSSTDGWQTQTALAWAVPPQSDWLPNGQVSVPNTTYRGVVDRQFTVYQNRLFLICAIDQSSPGTELAVVAVEMMDDGSIGTPFLVTPWAYTANTGYPSYSYDPILGPPLRATVDVYGQYGNGNAYGSGDADPGAWTQSGTTLCERGAVPLDAAGNNIAFIGRVCVGNAGSVSYVSTSSDAGATLTPYVPTGIPAGGSPVTGVRLSDGRIVTVGNPWPNRQSLYIAVWNSTGQTLQSLRSLINDNAPPAPYTTFAPIYPAVGKSGGPSYPGVWVDEPSGLLLISVSYGKESVVAMSVPLANL
jgi:hypothetical protein